MLDKVDRPEHVDVGDHDESRDGDADNSRSTRCAHGQRLERQPDRNKPISADHNSA